jgi:hypothetical protein
MRNPKHQQLKELQRQGYERRSPSPEDIGKTVFSPQSLAPQVLIEIVPAGKSPAAVRPEILTGGGMNNRRRELYQKPMDFPRAIYCRERLSCAHGRDGQPREPWIKKPEYFVGRQALKQFIPGESPECP